MFPSLTHGPFDDPAPRVSQDVRAHRTNANTRPLSVSARMFERAIRTLVTEEAERTTSAAERERGGSRRAERERAQHVDASRSDAPRLGFGRVKIPGSVSRETRATPGPSRVVTLTDDVERRARGSRTGRPPSPSASSARMGGAGGLYGVSPSGSSVLEAVTCARSHGLAARGAGARRVRETRGRGRANTSG
jgi:hypothetical protein